MKLKRNQLLTTLVVISASATTASLSQAQDTLLSNTFEDGSMGPWSVANGSDAGLYENGDVVSNMGAGDVAINYAPTGDFSLWEGRGGSYLVLTDPLPLGSTGYTSVTVSYSYNCRNATSTRRLFLDYSPDNGTTWSTVGAFVTGSGATTRTVSTNLTDQAKFRFTFGDSGGAAGPFFVDDVVITASPEFSGSYWDSDGATAGAGGATPAGTWGIDSFWSSSPDGDVATGAWTPGEVAVFSAGTDATGAYTVTVDGTQNIGGLSFKDGTPTLTGGTLNMTSDSFAFVGDGLTATVASAITDDAGSRVLSRTGSGTLVLAGSNGSASGSMDLNSGITRFDAPASIIGTGENLTLNSGAIMAFGGSFDGTTIQTALNDRVVTTSAGTIAVDGNTAVDFDFATAGLTAAYLGAISDTTYSGLLTPDGTTYRLGGAGGKLTLSNTTGMDETSPTIDVLGDVEISGDITAVTGTLTKTNSGTLTLSGANSYAANTTASGGTLVLAGSNSAATQTTINAATVQLASSSNGGLASGQLTLNNNSAVLQAVDADRAISNDVLLNASPKISGSQSLAINGALTSNNNRSLTNNIDAVGKELTLAGQINLSNNDTGRTLTLRSDINSSNIMFNVTGDIVDGGLGAGNLTLAANFRDNEPFYLSGTNTYSGLTNITNGTARIQGSQALSPNTEVRLDHTSGNNGKIWLLDDTAGTLNLPNTFSVRSNNSTGNHTIFVGNNNTANGGTSAGTTTGSTIAISFLDFFFAKSDTQYQEINILGANDYSLRIDSVELNNLTGRSAGATTESRFNPTTASVSIGDITMDAGNVPANDGVPLLVLDGSGTVNEVTGVISDATDALTTGQPLPLVKRDSSSWTLSGANTYTGGTTVSAGTLTIDGSLADSSMSVTGGTVNGSGTLTFNPTDQIDISGGTVDLSGFTVEGSGLTDPVYVIVDSVDGGSYTGTFAVENVPGYTVDYDYDGSGTQVALVSGAPVDPFVTWAGTGTLGPVTFEGDTNGDGVQDGMAFLLGVANPDDDANGSLPTVSEDGSGNLVMQFNCLPVDDRGTAELRVAHSNTLASFTATADQVPDADDAVADNDVTFLVTPGSPTNSVTATIDAAAAAGGKLFGRLEATE